MNEKKEETKIEQKVESPKFDLSKKMPVLILIKNQPPKMEEKKEEKVDLSKKTPVFY